MGLLSIALLASPAHALKFKCMTTYTGQGLQKLVDPSKLPPDKLNSELKEANGGKDPANEEEKKAAMAKVRQKLLQVRDKENETRGKLGRLNLQDDKRCSNKTPKERDSLRSDSGGLRKYMESSGGDMGCYCSDGTPKTDPAIASLKAPPKEPPPPPPEKAEPAPLTPEERRNVETGATVPAGQVAPGLTPGNFAGSEQQMIDKAGTLSGPQLARLQTMAPISTFDYNGQSYNVYQGYVGGSQVRIACPASSGCTR